VDFLKEELSQQREHTNKNSQNSSKPPSSDGPEVKRQKKAASGRFAGGQPGHIGKTRVAAPPERIDQYVDCLLQEACPHCGETEVVSKGFRSSHQVWEIPEIRPHVTEYQIESCRCKRCHRQRSASLPPGCDKSILGPRTQTLLSLLTGCFRLSRRNTEVFLREVCSLDISLGTVSNSEKKVSLALRPQHQAILQKARQSDVVYIDETGC